MSITNIGNQKTPGRPVEITFGPELGLPSDEQQVLLIGRAASGATGVDTVLTINNASDPDLALAEAETKLNGPCELADMVRAAVEANQGGGTFPAIKICPLGFGEGTISSDAVTAIKATKIGIGFVVTCFDLQNDTTERDILKDIALTMSGPQRVSNNQFGVFGVGANFDETDPSQLFAFDTQYLIGIYKRDSNPAATLGETAARAAARMAANNVPFNPLDDVTINGEQAPDAEADAISVGAGLESETVLNQGWTPLWVKPNGEVAFVRTVTGRLSADGTGTPVVGAYYDVQDFQVLYFWRKTLYTRWSQPDFKQRKASGPTATDLLGEAIRLASTFEDENMFQAVNRLARQFKVQRSSSDRHRFDVLTPVNVIPGLHVIATNIQATTQFDVISL